MRAFLDTNVILAGFLAEGVSHRVLREAIAGRFEPVVSGGILREAARNLRTKFRAPPALTAEVLQFLRDACRIVDVPAEIPRLCRDPDDDAVLSAASAAKADFLVTGDRDLLVLGSRRGTRIVSPSQFLRELEP